MLKNYALPTNPKAFAAQYEERIADLESRAPVNSCTDAERQQYEQTIRLQVEKIMDLEKRLADLSAPTVRDMNYDDMIRAFGQEGVGHIVELALDKTGRNETAEALQRVRERAQTIETHFRDGSGAKQPHTAKGAIKDFTTIIDVELAKLDQ